MRHIRNTAPALFALLLLLSLTECKQPVEPVKPPVAIDSTLDTLPKKFVGIRIVRGDSVVHEGDAVTFQAIPNFNLGSKTRFLWSFGGIDSIYFDNADTIRFGFTNAAQTLVLLKVLDSNGVVLASSILQLGFIAAPKFVGIRIVRGDSVVHWGDILMLQGVTGLPSISSLRFSWVFGTLDTVIVTNGDTVSFRFQTRKQTAVSLIVQNLVSDSIIGMYSLQLIADFPGSDIFFFQSYKRVYVEFEGYNHYNTGAPMYLLPRSGGQITLPYDDDSISQSHLVQTTLMINAEKHYGSEYGTGMTGTFKFSSDFSTVDSFVVLERGVAVENRFYYPISSIDQTLAGREIGKAFISPDSAVFEYSGPQLEAHMTKIARCISGTSSDHTKAYPSICYWSTQYQLPPVPLLRIIFRR